MENEWIFKRKITEFKKEKRVIIGDFSFIAKEFDTRKKARRKSKDGPSNSDIIWSKYEK